MLPENLLREYREQGKYLAQSPDHFTQSADAHNRAHRHLGGIWRKLKQDPSIDRSFFLQLLEDENPALRMLSAAHCLGLGVYVPQARKVLKKLTGSTDPYISSTAKFTLDTWRKNGTVRF